MAVKISKESLRAISFPGSYVATCKTVVLVGDTTVRVYTETHTGKNYYHARLVVGELGEDQREFEFENIDQVVGLYEALGNAIKIFDLSGVEVMIPPATGQDLKP